MVTREKCIDAIKRFRAKHAIDTSDENVIATMHLMNSYAVDVNAALDQSSRGANDRGIDAWYFDEKSGELYILQSKLSESRSTVLKGFSDLGRAQEWLEQVLVDGHVDAVPADNHCLFNLYTKLSSVKDQLRRIHLVLVSTHDRNDLEDSSEYGAFERGLVESPLNRFVQEHKGRLSPDIEVFNLEYGVPREIKVYPIPKIAEARILLRKAAYLDVAFVTLSSLIELYRRRGDVLFDKNVRLSLMYNKEARERLVSPMENTLDQITQGKMSPAIFPFYHIGVTISAASSSAKEEDAFLCLEAPSIINGCQTISIANEYLKRLERHKNEAALERFREIKVVAKVVVGTTTDELKEITNSNNRQNPIENWQLFSNESIHIEIEAALKDIGVFYERQKGKFESILKNSDSAKHYLNTNGTYIKVVDLAQVIALSRPQLLQWAAKPSEIFANKENHERVFDRSIPRYPRDMVFVSNIFKAMKRGLNKAALKKQVQHIQKG
ncbi:MAG TPA: AIPR family protein [Terracidiphilus sp.]